MHPQGTEEDPVSLLWRVVCEQDAVQVQAVRRHERGLGKHAAIQGGRGHAAFTDSEEQPGLSDPQKEDSTQPRGRAGQRRRGIASPQSAIGDRLNRDTTRDRIDRQGLSNHIAGHIIISRAVLRRWIAY